MNLRKTLLALTCAVIVALPAASDLQKTRWTPEAGDVIKFNVLLKGEPFGTHAVRFEEAADGTLVARTDVSLRAGLGPVTLYRYQLSATEKWRNGKLVEVKGSVNDDGDKRSVTATRVGDAIKVNGSNFKGTAPEGVVPSSHWNYAQTMTQKLLSTEDGEIIDVKVRPAGRETLTIDGKPIAANRYRFHSAVDIDLWYDEQGRWVKLAFEARGQEIEYVLDRLY